MKNRILSALAIILFHAAAAQKFTATVDRNDILIGEQFRLHLQANFLGNEPLMWKSIDTIPRFEILSKSEVDTVKVEEGFALSQDFLLTSWDSGKLQIPSFILYRWQTKPIPINVAYSPSPFDTTQPYHEIRDILEVRKPIEEQWYWYLILLLVIVVLFLLFFPKGKKKDKTEFVPDEGAYKTALKKLEKLKAADASDPKQLYTELILVFREYLKRRKNIHSFSKTTDDLGLQLQKLKMDRDQYGELLQTMRLSDLVKFAKFHPSREEDLKSIETIKESIMNIENLPHVV